MTVLAVWTGVRYANAFVAAVLVSLKSHQIFVFFRYSSAVDNHVLFFSLYSAK